MVIIHWRMLILECSQRCYGRTDCSVTISLRNFVGEGIINHVSDKALSSGRMIPTGTNNPAAVVLTQRLCYKRKYILKCGWRVSGIHFTCTLKATYCYNARLFIENSEIICLWGGRRNRMVVGFTTTYAMNTYHH